MVDTFLDVLALSAPLLCIVGFGVSWHRMSLDLASLSQVSDPVRAEEESEERPETQKWP